MDDDRIQAYLDGELPLEALNGAERAEAVRFEHAVQAAADPLRRMASPDLTSAIMTRIAVADAKPVVGPVRAFLAWLWNPQPVRLRPALGFAVVAAAVVLVSWAGQRPGAPVAAAVRPVYVQFRLDAQGAASVALAADFTDWQPRYVMQQTAPGVWSIMVPVAPGVHDYAFVIDGERWVADPDAPRVDDGFGGSNSRLSIVNPASLETS